MFNMLESSKGLGRQLELKVRGGKVVVCVSYMQAQGTAYAI